MSHFRINFFDLMWLSDSVIPPQSIAREVTFGDFSDKYYHEMTEEERKQFFEHVTKNPRFDLLNAECKHFYARFNPKNQYVVTAVFDRIASAHNCYLHNDNYHTAHNRWIHSDYITEVVRVFDGLKIK